MPRRLGKCCHLVVSKFNHTGCSHTRPRLTPGPPAPFPTPPSGGHSDTHWLQLWAHEIHPRDGGHSKNNLGIQMQSRQTPEGQDHSGAKASVLLPSLEISQCPGTRKMHNEKDWEKIKGLETGYKSKRNKQVRPLIPDWLLPKPYCTEDFSSRPSIFNIYEWTMCSLWGTQQESPSLLCVYKEQSSKLDGRAPKPQQTSGWDMNWLLSFTGAISTVCPSSSAPSAPVTSVRSLDTTKVEVFRNDFE